MLWEVEEPPEAEGPLASMAHETSTSPEEDEGILRLKFASLEDEGDAATLYIMLRFWREEKKPKRSWYYEFGSAKLNSLLYIELYYTKI